MEHCDCNNRSSEVDEPILVVRYRCKNCGAICGSIPINWEDEDLERTFGDVLKEAVSIGEEKEYLHEFDRVSHIHS